MIVGRHKDIKLAMLDTVARAWMHSFPQTNLVYTSLFEMLSDRDLAF